MSCLWPNPLPPLLRCLSQTPEEEWPSSSAYSLHSRFQLLGQAWPHLFLVPGSCEQNCLFQYELPKSWSYFLFGFDIPKCMD